MSSFIPQKSPSQILEHSWGFLFEKSHSNQQIYKVERKQEVKYDVTSSFPSNFDKNRVEKHPKMLFPQYSCKC